MRHLDDVTSADTGRRPIDNQWKFKLPLASLKFSSACQRGMPSVSRSALRSIDPYPQRRLDELIARGECRHQVEPSVVEETRDRGQRCLGSIDIDEQEMG